MSLTPHHKKTLISLIEKEKAEKDAAKITAVLNGKSTKQLRAEILELEQIQLLIHKGAEI